MRKATLAFLLGVLALYPFTDLPDARLGAAALPLLVASIRFHSLRVPAWFALGFAWALLRGASILATGLPPVLEGEPLVIEGTVAGLPRAYERALNFDMDVVAVTGMGREWPSPGHVRLSWYGRERILVPGETWRFAVKLKRPHGFIKPYMILHSKNDFTPMAQKACRQRTGDHHGQRPRRRGAPIAASAHCVSLRPSLPEAALDAK